MFNKITKTNIMKFDSLVGRINLIQDTLQAHAANSVNLSLTARNWLVGYYIVEFEQNGEDRAKYGDKPKQNGPYIAANTSAVCVA